MYDELKEGLKSLHEKNVFEVGNIVRWKRNLKNRRSNGPFIITEVLDPPIMNGDTESGSAYFRELLDVKAAMPDRDCEFTEFHYDSRRFEKVEE